MTENEAKTKWCPMSRFSTYDGTGVSNRDNFQSVGHSAEGCIASACMMWREDLTREEAQNGVYAKDGHCGLGGNP